MTTWTKGEAASDQLDGAILLLSDGNFIGVHSLVAVGAELASACAAKTGKVTNAVAFERLIERNAPHRLDEVRRVFRRPQNFAKHADRDHDKTIDVEPEFTIFMLAQALTDIGIAFNKQTFRQNIFRAWFSARWPELMTGDGSETYLEGARKVFPHVGNNLASDLRALRATILDLDTPEFREKFKRNMASVTIDWSLSLVKWGSLAD